MKLETLSPELQQYEPLLARMQQQMETELVRRASENRIDSYYPNEGPLRRELYRKHLEFFRAGIEHRERCFLAANRVGKTEGVGGYELTCHLTGEYPDWWEGRTFDHPIEAWAAGDTSQTVRDIIQAKLLGPVGSFGTGLIRKALIARTTGRQGIPDAVQDIYVKHKGGGTSWVTLKSYDQKRLSFQGTGKHVIWLDEEPDLGVYSECLLRTMTTNGLVMCTFTPMLGLSEVVMNYLPEGRIPL
jgi:phage terminase large subunit-like protein